MIALLPLRGWVGDAMATQMAAHAVQQAATSVSESDKQQPQLVAANSAAFTGHHAGVAAANGAGIHDTLGDHASSNMTPDCANQVAADAETSVGTDCANCAACQACHTVALSHTEPANASAMQHASLPSHGIAQFTSAEAALGQKPPIS